MLRKPVPTGVVIGAFKAQRVRLTLAITASGSGVPVRAITSMPASCTSQLIATPVASMHLRAASANSGPVPSPVIKVTSYAISSHLLATAVVANVADSTRRDADSEGAGTDRMGGGQVMALSVASSVGEAASIGPVRCAPFRRAIRRHRARRLRQFGQ